MLQQGVLGGQCLAAHGAGVRPLPRVHPGMHLQGVLLSKALSTLITFEGSLPCNQTQEAWREQEPVRFFSSSQIILNHLC